MHSYLDRLQSEVKKKGSLLCFGMDPIIERMRIDEGKNLADEIVGYFSRIIAEIAPRITAVKPNLGFYLQYGMQGMNALQRLIDYARGRNLPVILDAKSGDIGNTSCAYARFAFEVLNADAVTLNPYMGYDSLAPFFAHRGKGFYVLALTSNRGASLFQHEILASGKSLYESIIERICEWNSQHDSVGAVIGATQARFQTCIEEICSAGFQVPLLIPGVGAQGGSYGKIKAILEKSEYAKGIVRINASSSISYAYERAPDLTVEEAAHSAVLETLNS